MYHCFLDDELNFWYVFCKEKGMWRDWQSPVVGVACHTVDCVVSVGASLRQAVGWIASYESCVVGLVKCYIKRPYIVIIITRSSDTQYVLLLTTRIRSLHQTID